MSLYLIKGIIIYANLARRCILQRQYLLLFSLMGVSCCLVIAFLDFHKMSQSFDNAVEFHSFNVNYFIENSEYYHNDDRVSFYNNMFDGGNISSAYFFNEKKTVYFSMGDYYKKGLFSFLNYDDNWFRQFFNKMVVLKGGVDNIFLTVDLSRDVEWFIYRLISVIAFFIFLFLVGNYFLFLFHYLNRQRNGRYRKRMSCHNNGLLDQTAFNVISDQQIPDYLNSIMKHLHNEDTTKKLMFFHLGIDNFHNTADLSDDKIINVQIEQRLKEFVGQCFDARKMESGHYLFIIDFNNPYEGALLALKMINCFSEPVICGQQSLLLSAAVGIAIFPDDSDNVQQLVLQAQLAMDMAKSRSHHRYQFHLASVDRSVREKIKLEEDLQKALDNDHFCLVFQPQIDYQTFRLSGAEVLLRWQHPEKGIIGPDVFIPMAEQNHAIIPMGKWVIEKACEQLHQWHKNGYHTLRIAVNISVIQLQSETFVSHVKSVLEHYQITPGHFEMEITESCSMESETVIIDRLYKLKAMGIILTLDDFGTGYSSLNYLKYFPFDRLKIDRGFVDNIPDDKENSVIVDAIIQLGKNFDIGVVAEGIETKEQEIYLIRQGCIEGQGYFYGKPMDVEAFTGYLHGHLHQEPDSDWMPIDRESLQADPDL
ncbi:putative signaling protein [invertebrate metagenome]|uniref:Putative signaling protein n=1 Tax=invertebrate metagenome TaxID=1711999 RepID=A0A2H9TCE2_9ZZZZ